MIESFFVINTSGGEVLIEKHWRGVTSRLECDFFWGEVSKYERNEEMPPILHHGDKYLLSILRGNIFFLGITTREVAPLGSLEFLHRVFDIFEEYFGSVEEVTIKDNFSTVYQLLEEMMDYGFPLTTEPNALKAMIKPPSIVQRISSAMGGSSSQVSDVLPDGTISNMPWRLSGVSYTQNEIYLDIIEEVDSILSVDGMIVSSEVSGVIQANSKLSGVPDLALQFSDPRQIDDCSFHPCVRYNRFERDQVVSFVPPDGLFELMRYRVLKRDTHVVAPCYCSPTVAYDFENSKGTITVLAGTRSTSSLVFPSSAGQSMGGSVAVEEVTVTIPFMRNVRTANLVASEGTVLYDETTKVAKWKIGTINKDHPLKLTGTMILSKIAEDSIGSEESPAVQMHWSVPSASISGMSVASLTLSNADYKPYKGVRTIAQSGKFQVRTV